MINEREEIELIVAITKNKSGELADVGVFTPSQLSEQLDFIQEICPKELGYKTEFKRVYTNIEEELKIYKSGIKIGE